MVSITLSVSSEIRALMNRFSEINWSGFVKKAISQKVRELSWKEEMLKRLKGEEQFSQWAVGVQRDSRKGRF